MEKDPQQMSTTILAGDIGGTNTRLALFEHDGTRPAMAVEKIYPSRNYSGLEEIVKEFAQGQTGSIKAACFGIAGPVVKGKATVSNLPWTVEAAKLAQELQLPGVALINDLAAHGYGIDDLNPADFVSLNAVEASEGNAAIIAAGTGLGEAGLYWDGQDRHPFSSEGGHATFAPQNELEIRLYQYLAGKFGHASSERVLSGPGLKNIYDFLKDSGVEQEPDWLHQELANCTDASATISRLGMEGKATICERTLDIFVAALGSEAGNLALRFLATAGVFLSGGIAAKILPKVQQPIFLQAFLAKGRLQRLLEKIPVKVITNDKVGLIGAARRAVLDLR
jgi:glucokinase